MMVAPTDRYFPSDPHGLLSGLRLAPLERAMDNATACGSRKVVVVPNHGRLGNQIFQFAVCYAIATEHGLCASPLRAACATRPSHP